MKNLSCRFALVGLLLGGVSVWAGAGCDDQYSQQSQSKAPTGGEALPTGLIVSSAPEGAKGVAEVRKAGDGEEVVVHGRVAGRAEPFTEGRAQFQLVDMSVRSCAETPDDECPTPWDMCCEDKQEVLDNSVTVQVVGADGQPLKTQLNGVGGLKPLSEVSVKGTLKKSPDGKAVMVNATEMYVKQS